MHFSKYRFASALFFIVAISGALWPAMPSSADDFTISDLDGRYGISLSGFAADGFGFPTPVSAVGQMTVVDGFTNDSTRTFNVGSFGIVDGVLVGNAEVQPNGRGVAVFCGENTVRPPAVLPLFPRRSLEVFEFVLTGKDVDEVLFISTAFGTLPDSIAIADCPLPSDVLPVVPVSGPITGMLRRQDENEDDD